MHGLQTAIVMVNPDESGTGGVIDMQIAIDALMWTAADLLVRTGHVSSPRDCRLKGEALGKRITQVAKASLDAQARGDFGAWEVRPIGIPN